MLRIIFKCDNALILVTSEKYPTKNTFSFSLTVTVEVSLKNT